MMWMVGREDFPKATRVCVGLSARWAGDGAPKKEMATLTGFEPVLLP